MSTIKHFIKLLWMVPLALFAAAFAPGALTLALPEAAPRASFVSAKPNRRRGAKLYKRRQWYGGTPMTREQMSRLTNLEVALRAVFMDQMQAVAGSSLLNSLFNIQESSRAVERNLGVGGFSNVPEYRGTIEYDGLETLYRADYQHREYAKGTAIERKLIDDDEYGVMRQRVQLMGLSFDRTIETFATSVFANAFTAGATAGPDGVALCSASHPYSPTNAATQSNAGTTALSHDAVSTTRQAMMRFKDSAGFPMPVNPDVLLVPIELEDTARVIVESGLRSGTPNNDMNANRSYSVITSRYLTDSNNWFLIDSRLARMWLNWYWRVRPEFVTDPKSDFDLELRFRGYFRCAFGWDSWQWVYGHNVP